MSAIADENASSETIKVLFTLFPDFDLQSVAGPLEALSLAHHNPKDSDVPSVVY